MQITIMIDKITFLLPTKGRDNFTIRLLKYFNMLKTPINLIIGDGMPNTNSYVLNDKEKFPHINYEYIEYNDTNWLAYYKKVYDMCTKANTKYVMLIDNDDFPLISGISKNIEFLENNSEYISSRGNIGGFELKNKDDKLYGEIVRFNLSYFDNYRHEIDENIDNYEKLKLYTKLNIPLFYNIFRKDILLNILNEAIEINFTDLNLHEFYFTSYAAVTGKNNFQKNTMTYLRQYNTSSQFDKKNNWANHLLFSNYTTEFNNILFRLYSKLNNTSLKYETFSFEIKNLYSVNLSNRLETLFNTQLKNNNRGVIFLSWLKFILKSFYNSTKKIRINYSKVLIDITNRSDINDVILFLKYNGDK